MPNWCTNELIVSGEIEEMDKWRMALTNDESIEPTLDFNKIVPEPRWEEDSQDWYQWRIDNWGTKWNANDVDTNNDLNEILYHFDTAWGPPIEFVETAAKKFPNLYFQIAFYEEGCCFAGMNEFKDGELAHREIHHGVAEMNQFVADRFDYEIYSEEELQDMLEEEEEK